MGKALRYYRLSLKNNPQNLRARYFYGNAFNRRWNLHRHYNEAWGDRNSIPRTDLQRTMEQYEYIIRQAPHFTEIDFELGDLFLKLGDIDRAIASYKDYRRYKPFFTKIHYALANAYVAKKDWTNAIESYKDALDLNKKFTVAYLELSAVYRITGQDDLAEEMYELAREESPDKVDLAMADIWVRMGDKERAIRSCQARIDKDSTDVMAYAKLGWYYIKKQEWAEAVTIYEKVVRFNPRYAPAYINLSNLYYELGRIDDARQAYQKAYAIDPLYVRSVSRR